MAIDKAIDSARLDGALEATAEKIREKTGDSAKIAWNEETGFADAVGAILTGNGSNGSTNIAELLGETLITLDSDTTYVGPYRCQNLNSLTTINLPNCTTFGSRAFSSCKALKHVIVPALVKLNGYAFVNCSSLEELFFPEVTNIGWGEFANCTALRTVIFNNIKDFPGACFSDCSSIKSIVINKSTLCAMTNVNAFEKSVFASGGVGGTIYIPKVLYDELGTGSALDYKAATNWATYDAYGTITWAQIEGSEYE